MNSTLSSLLSAAGAPQIFTFQGTVEGGGASGRRHGQEGGTLGTGLVPS